jgi:hypothetical protein
MGYAMREFDSQHAADRDDSGVDAHPGHTVDERQARYEGERDAETRTASALEYRRRVDEVYAAYSATHAPPQGAGGKHAIDSGRRGHVDPSGKPGISHSAGYAAADRTRDLGEAAATKADSGEQSAEPATHGTPDNIDTARPGHRPRAAASELTCTEPPTRGNGPSATLEAEHSALADDDRPQLPPPGQDGPQRGMRATEPGDSWPPPEDDQER